MEYEKTILKFKNKDYIKKLLDKYNFLQNRILKKERVFINAITKSLWGGLITAILGTILNNRFIIIGAMLFLFIIILSFLLVKSKYLSGNESRQLKILNDKFVEDVRSNPSILQDLSTLVVDESSKDTFIYLTDIILSQEEFPEALNMLIDILEYSPNPLYTFSHEEKRNKLMKSLNIALNIKEEVPVKNKVSDKQKTKQKLLDML